MGILLSNLDLKVFRGIHDLSLTSLSTINVLVGANNCGKTSVLEAIKLMSSPGDVGNLIRVSSQRASVGSDVRLAKAADYFSNILTKDPAEHGTYTFDISATIRDHLYHYTVAGDSNEVVDSSGVTKKAFSFSTRVQKDDGKAVFNSYRIINGQAENFEATENGLFGGIYVHSSTRPYPSCVHFLSESIINEQKATLLEVLQLFDAEIDDISIVGDDVYIHNKESGVLPLFVYGTGLQKTVLLTSLLTAHRSGIVLIDEIDNAINISAFRDVFSWFIRACRMLNVQAFVTTHSAEAVDAMLENVTDDSDDIRIITMRKDRQFHKTRAVVRSGRQAKRDRIDFEMELRV